MSVARLHDVHTLPVYWPDFSLENSSSKLNNNSTSNSADAVGTHAIVVDLQSHEAVASGLLLLKMLRPLFAGASTQLFVAGLDSLAIGKPMRMPSTVVAAVLLCTTGCFNSLSFLQALIVTIIGKVPHVLPAAASKDFVFPTSAFYSDLEATVHNMSVAAGGSADGTLLTAFVKSIFQKIFMHFFVQDSWTILTTQTDIIYRRLMRRMTTSQPSTALEDSRFDSLTKLYAQSIKVQAAKTASTQSHDDSENSDGDMCEI